MAALPTLYSGGPVLRLDGSFIVRPGDWLSKYSQGIYGDFDHIHEFYRSNGNPPEEIKNKDLIKAGERLWWLPDRPGNGKPVRPIPGKPGLPGLKPIDLDDPGRNMVPVPLEFIGEWKVPKKAAKEWGYFCAQFQFSFSGRLSGVAGVPSRVTVSREAVKTALTHRFESKVDATFSHKFEYAFIESLRSGVTNQSPNEFKSAFLKNLELAFQRSFSWRRVTFTPQFTMRPFHPETPFALALTFEYGDDEALEIDGQKYRLSGTGKGQINFGLSKAGWAKLLELVGRSRLVSFLQRLGGRVLVWLAAEGIIIGVAVLASLALTALVAWAYNKALTPDESRLALDWYVYGYTHAIFHGGGNRSAQPRHEEMRVLGEQDAVADGRRMLREAGDPSAEGSPRAVLLASRYLICQWYEETYQWGETKAEWQFTQELRTLAAQKLAGR